MNIREELVKIGEWLPEDKRDPATSLEAAVELVELMETSYTVELSFDREWLCTIGGAWQGRNRNLCVAICTAILKVDNEIN